MVHETLKSINNQASEAACEGEAGYVEAVTETKPLDITQRVSLSIAVGNFIRSRAAFDEACTRFNESCSAMRNMLRGRQSRFVAKIDFKNHLVTSNLMGDFDVEEIETL
jgi:hypothetical protein